jgi:CheY-like chemotaxis protein
MTQRSERPLSIACVTDQSENAAALYEALLTLFPMATVTRVDTDVERTLPDLIDCAVVDSMVNGIDGLDVVRRLRARGFDGAAVLLVDPAASPEAGADASLARLGVHACALDSDVLTPLATAISEAVGQRPADGAAHGSTVKALRQTQRLLAAGELAMRLQHSLNNPLAALLAEAQLLELEQLTPDHRGSVERIIELSRRVIEVVRGLDGVGRA